MPIPNDPLLVEQWHLGNPTPGLLDLNVRGVWDPVAGLAFTGRGVRVFVLDSGFDPFHPDLAPNYNAGLSWDFTDGDADPYPHPFGGGVPSSDDAHGTAVMGIIGAAANGSGAVGIAYQAELVGYRIGNPGGTPGAIEAAISSAAVDGGDLCNISYGMGAGGAWLTSEFAMRAAIGDAVSTGRDGLGMTIVKSAGNSRAEFIDTNCDHWSQDTRQVVVAAVDQNGWVSDYSTPGASILVSAFGTPGEVLTTDITGPGGLDSGDFTGIFNGTSSAAPMVAGIVALIYDAAPELGWRDVQSILAASARHVGSGFDDGALGAERFEWAWNDAATWNGGGMHYSNDYGFGLVDAFTAVRLAETWLRPGLNGNTSANEATASVDVLNATVNIPDDDLDGVSFSGNVASNLLVERVTVQMSFSSSFASDLQVTLISPGGTESILITAAGNGETFNGTWTFETQALRGERAAGLWTVNVADTAGEDLIQVTDVRIRVFGASSLGDRFIITDAYSELASGTPVITDRNGGIDTLNAAALTSNSVIRLSGLANSLIDGVTTIVRASIEHVYGGDGEDRIVGSDRGNQLHGRHGADSISGLGGDDLLIGGTGSDKLIGGTGRDIFDFNRTLQSQYGSIDTIMGGSGAAAFEGVGAAVGDRIDVTDIDARAGRSGDQDFTFAFSGSATGTIRVVERGDGVSRVLGFVDRVAGADFVLDIFDGGIAASAYRAADFIL